MTECLQVRDLCFEREKNGVSFALRIPELSVQAGDITAVVGESGCGKSTLSDLVALILEPTSCACHTLSTAWGPVDVRAASEGERARIRGRDIGYVLQSGGLLSFLNVLDNIMLPGRLLGYPEPAVRERALALARAMGIEGQLRKKPQFLSGGQRQRVAIARALIHQPRLVLADEPTAAVDAYTAREICSIFRSIAVSERAALLIVSHDRNLMHEYADWEVSFTLTHGNNCIQSCLTAPRRLRAG